MDSRIVLIGFGAVGMVCLYFMKLRGQDLKFKFSLKNKLRELNIYDLEPDYVEQLLEDAHNKAFSKAEDLPGQIYALVSLLLGNRVRRKRIGFNYDKYKSIVWNSMLRRARKDGKIEIARILELNCSLLGILQDHDSR
jgi:hypothetical protein